MCRTLLLEISGIRLGTPAIPSRGLGVPEMIETADLISRVIAGRGAPGIIASLRTDVANLTARFPLGWEDLAGATSAQDTERASPVVPL